ncbi:MAG TPA: hypothetical protein DEQ88_05200 [Clostridiales bacterium]|nr:hypothetical protein [Clostridiales bacterium]
MHQSAEVSKKASSASEEKQKNRSVGCGFCISGLSARKKNTKKRATFRCSLRLPKSEDFGGL